MRSANLCMTSTPPARVDAPNTIQDLVDIKNYYALVLPPSFGYYTSGMISI